MTSYFYRQRKLNSHVVSPQNGVFHAADSHRPDCAITAFGESASQQAGTFLKPAQLNIRQVTPACIKSVSFPGPAAVGHFSARRQTNFPTQHLQVSKAFLFFEEDTATMPELQELLAKMASELFKNSDSATTLGQETTHSASSTNRAAEPVRALFSRMASKI